MRSWNTWDSVGLRPTTLIEDFKISRQIYKDVIWISSNIILSIYKKRNSNNKNDIDVQNVEN
jgi:hypothetical protein